MSHGLAPGVQNSFTCLLKTLTFFFFIFNFQAEKVMRVKQSISLQQLQTPAGLEGAAGRKGGSMGKGDAELDPRSQSRAWAQVQQRKEQVSTMQTASKRKRCSRKITKDAGSLVCNCLGSGRAPSWGELCKYSDMSWGAGQTPVFGLLTEKSGRKGGVLPLSLLTC